LLVVVVVGTVRKSVSRINAAEKASGTTIARRRRIMRGCYCILLTTTSG